MAMTTSSSLECKKLFSEKLYEYLLEQPNQCDVTFSVGPTKEKVGAVRLILVVASPEFRKLFEEKWDLALMKKYNGIPIPDVDAKAFKIFLKLLPSEHTTIKDLEKYEFTTEQVLNLRQISKQFGMGNLYTALEDMSKPFLKVCDIASRSDFLKLSVRNLAVILSNEDNPMKEIDIFLHVCRWAKHQCSEQNLKTTQENMRNILGECLHEIRFPLMSIKEFGKIVCAENILTDAEISKIFRFISLDEEDRKSFDFTSMGFKCHKRTGKLNLESKPMKISTIRIYKDLKLTSSRYYACNGEISVDRFNVNERIELLGIGFPGPANFDGDYDIVVEVKSFQVNGELFETSGKMEQRIQAKYKQPFQFMFKKPFICIPSESKYNYNASIFYSLNGPNMQLVENFKDITLDVQLARTQDEITFGFGLQSKQILELLFRKLM